MGMSSPKGRLAKTAKQPCLDSNADSNLERECSLFSTAPDAALRVRTPSGTRVTDRDVHSYLTEGLGAIGQRCFGLRCGSTRGSRLHASAS
jgi:hypothetical protein